MLKFSLNIYSKNFKGVIMEANRCKLAIFLASLMLMSCSEKEKSIIGKGNGFSGEIKVNVVTKGDRIDNLELGQV